MEGSAKNLVDSTQWEERAIDDMLSTLQAHYGFMKLTYIATV
jgi:hypothetical protein